MVLYGLKTCDTCRKALKSLPQAEFVCVRDTGVPEDVLTLAHDTFGPMLVNTRSATWRGLSDAERAEFPVTLIQRHPAVMKRPLIQEGARLHLGWGPQVQVDLGVS